jgi:hypothetical protein
VPSNPKLEKKGSRITKKHKTQNQTPKMASQVAFLPNEDV